MERSFALVADADPAARAAIRELLEQRKVMTLGAESAGEALEALGDRRIDLLFVDLSDDRSDMRSVVRHARGLQHAPLLVGLVNAGEGAGDGLPPEPGLFDVLPKPPGGDPLRFAVERALRQTELLAEVRGLRAELQGRQGFRGLVGRSAPMQRLRDQFDRLASTESSLWFCGEPGSGKSLAARTLHAASSRAAGPFVVLDCAAPLSADWERAWSAEGDSFGGKDPGLQALARGGTLYLDDVTALDASIQERLLDALSRLPRFDVARSSESPPAPRVHAAAAEEPGRAVEQGRLLEGLRLRLAESTIRVPALREHAEDIALLARHFVLGICEVNQLPAISFARDALALLERYTWPGNVRELRNVVEHAVIISEEGTIRSEDLPDRIREHARSRPQPGRTAAGERFRDAKRVAVDTFEFAYLSELLERHGGNVTLASQQAGMLRSALQRLLRKHEIKSAEFRRRRAAPSRKELREPAFD